MASSQIISVSSFYCVGAAALVLVLNDDISVPAVAVGVLGVVQLLMSPRESVTESGKADLLVHTTLLTLLAAVAGSLWALWNGALLETALFAIVAVFESMALSTAKRRRKQAQVFDNIFTE